MSNEDPRVDAYIARAAPFATSSAHMGAMDTRRLYLPLGYPSMVQYCVHELRWSERSACKRIRVARAAREFPVLFESLADGRLNLSGVLLLVPHLAAGNMHELIAAASHRTNEDIEGLVTNRFPRTEPIGWVQPLGSAGETTNETSLQLPARGVSFDAPKPSEKPVARNRFALQFAIGAETKALLEEARQLLSHRVAHGDLSQIVHLALTELVEKLRKQKRGATDRPRTTRPRTHGHSRHIPSQVRREVWERDGGRCTFVGETGVRCPSRGRLEYDPIHPFALGGRATSDNLRLRCRAHNQYEAEKQLGADVMAQKRSAARERLMVELARDEAEVQTVVPWLRKLGFRSDEARKAAWYCETLPEQPLEQQILAAIRFLRPRGPHSDGSMQAFAARRPQPPAAGRP